MRSKILNLLTIRKYKKWAKQNKEKKTTLKETLKGLNLLTVMDVTQFDMLDYQTIYMPSYVLTLYDLVYTLEELSLAIKQERRPVPIEGKVNGEKRLDRWMEFPEVIDLEDVISVLIKVVSKLEKIRECSDVQSYIDRKSKFCLVTCNLFIEAIGEMING